MTASAPVLLITGGSRGIGAATAKLAGMRGFDVAVNYRNNGEAADEVVAAVRSLGRSALAVQGDMASEADVARMFATVERDLGPPTHVVYSCGITGRPSRVETVATETLREVLDVNVLGALLCVRAAIPPHLDPAWRTRRRDRADLLGCGDARQRRRIRLVRREQGRDR